MKTINTQVCGGAVRDLVIYLLKNNLPLKLEGNIEDYFLKAGISDIDRVVIGETVESMNAMGYESVGKSFPVYMVEGEEHALLRKEESTGDGYGDFNFETNGVSRKEDASRRDFRFNAMFINPDGTIEDFFGGIEDLKNGVIHHTSDAFDEDPLRALRAARFLSRFNNFVIADATIEKCKALKPKMKALTKDRIFKELKKVLNENNPSLFFRALIEMDILSVTFPHIHNMLGVEQRFDYHAEGDVLEHTLRVGDQVCEITENPISRYAAYFHDIGKPITFEKTEKFHGHEADEVVAPLFEELIELDHDKKYVAVAKKIAVFHHFVHNFRKMKATTLVKKMKGKDFPRKGFEFQALLDVCMADERGRVSGTRKLTKEENDIIFNGGHIDGFILAERTVDYSFLIEVFEEIHKKVVIPDDILDKKGRLIGEFVYQDTVRRVKALKRNQS